MRIPRSLALGLSIAALAPCASRAQDVELELVLLADATQSIDNAEIYFQRQGYASALTDPSVLAVIAGSAYGRIAVTYVEWGGQFSQDVVVPWTIIDGPDSAQAFARELMRKPRLAYGRNAIGAALLYGMRLIEENDIEGWRKVIDFSGDSANNYYPPSIGWAREKVLENGVVINGLAILCRACSGPADDQLARRYEQQIIGGPGAFVVAAESRDTFAEAVRKKLLLEIAGEMPAATLAAK